MDRKQHAATDFDRLRADATITPTLYRAKLNAITISNLAEREKQVWLVWKRRVERSHSILRGYKTHAVMGS